MSSEDALFRAMRHTAEALLREKLRNGDSIDLDNLSTQTLQQFQHIIDLSDYAIPLRARITAHLRELMSNGQRRS